MVAISIPQFLQRVSVVLLKGYRPFAECLWCNEISSQSAWKPLSLQELQIASIFTQWRVGTAARLLYLLDYVDLWCIVVRKILNGKIKSLLWQDDKLITARDKFIQKDIDPHWDQSDTPSHVEHHAHGSQSLPSMLCVQYISIRKQSSWKFLAAFI